MNQVLKSGLKTSGEAEGAESIAASVQELKPGGDGMEPVRIPAAEAYRLVKTGKALLVCAYPDEAKCNTMKLEGGVSRTEFESRLPGIKKDQEIVFYCS